jgi:hypothetical protein
MYFGTEIWLKFFLIIGCHVHYMKCLPYQLTSLGNFHSVFVCLTVRLYIWNLVSRRQNFHSVSWFNTKCGTMFVLAATVPMTHVTNWHRQITDWSSTEQFRMSCLQWHLVKFPHWFGVESYKSSSGLLENFAPGSEAWSCASKTVDCLVMIIDGAQGWE